MAKTAATTPAVQAWDMVETTRLISEARDIEPAAELVAAISADGIQDPIYVVPAVGGALRVVDGRQRLAAAIAALLTHVPVTFRPLIRVEALTAHPGNVRRDLAITKEMRASVRAEGVRVPLLVTQDGDAWRVVDGHRRLATALAEHITHVPYAIEQRDAAGQMLDMVTTARHRDGLTDAEEAAALFQAAELGAAPKRLAAAAGVSQAEAKRRVRIGGSAVVRATGTAQLSMELLAKLAELEELDAEAAAAVAATIEKDPQASITTHRWTIQQAHQRAEVRRQSEAHRTELEAKGARIRTLDEMSDRAERVGALPISYADHEACQGAVWVLEPGSPKYSRYCTNPALYGHAPKTAAAQAPADKEAARAARRRVIEGNKDWDAAETIRREWIADLLGRKRHPKATADLFVSIVTRELISTSDVLAKKHGGAWEQAAEWLGIRADSRDALIERTSQTTRNPAHQFAVLAACYEATTRRESWRTDGDHAERSGYYSPRTQTRRWLGWLAELGYEPTPIERAVMDADDYTPGQPCKPLS